MASIEKRGNSYRLRAYVGTKPNGSRIIRTTTWTPPEGMPPRRVQKEAMHRAELFEEECRKFGVQTMGGDTTLEEFTQHWLDDYAAQTLKPSTVANYRFYFKRINEELGNMRLDRIQPHHLLQLYKKLSGEECADSERMIATARLSRIMKQRRLSAREVSKGAGVYINAVSVALRGEALDRETADKIAAELGVMTSQIFTPKPHKTLSASTVRHYHTAISSALSTAVDWQMIERNPAKSMRPPRAEKTEAEYLDDVQAIHLLELLESEPILYRTAVTVLLYTGMRRGELCGLHWDDINFEVGTISISRSVSYLSGKGLYVDTTKTRSSVRVIRVPSQVIRALRIWRKTQAEERLKVGDLWVEDGYVFTRPFGQPMRPDSLSAWFREFIKRTDLPPIHLHSLRHTNASLMIANGTNIQTVASRMGHSSSATTSKIYSHAIMSADAAASEMLEDLLKPRFKRQKSSG